MYRLIVLLAVAVICSAGHAADEAAFTNSVGIKFVRIEPGTFEMGLEKDVLPEAAVTYHYPGHYKSEDRPPAAGWKGHRQGLVAVLYFDPEFIGPRLLDHAETIDFDWSNEERNRPWSARWRGYIKSPVTANIKFEAEAEKSIRLIINKQIVFDGWKDESVRSGTFSLDKDELVPIVLEYNYFESQNYIRLFWTLPGGKREIIPAEALWHSADDYNLNMIQVSWVPERTSRHKPKIGSDVFNESPRHKVTITKPFYISETEVTIDQFRRFRKEYPGYEKFAPYASGVSWHDAKAFCDWLGRKEGKSYRLPTEAEWEFACRAGTSTAYSAGDVRPESGTANLWGIRNMHSDVAEWTLDWHGIYPTGPQVDPIGPEHGWFKVVRGDCLDYTVLDQAYYARSSNRAAAPPSFGPPPADYAARQIANQNMAVSEALNSWFKTSGVVPGRHGIGFRVVQAAMPKTKTRKTELPFWQKCVKQTSHGIKRGPDMSKPYYRTRLLYPDFGGESLVDVAWEIGVERGYGGGHHNSALQALPNGDLLAAYYNTMLGGERDACVSIMTMRLRHGSNEWDMPSSWPDMVDADDEAPIIWNDDGKIWFFWGCPRMEAGYPFQYTSSTDNGTTWGPIEFPLFDSKIGYFSAQPINSAFRDSKGTIYVAVDGSRPSVSSELFASRDGGKTWYDTGGRTSGRHSTFVLLDDDVILAYAGKQAELGGYHPQYISHDHGRTYKETPSPLPALGSGVRASAIKLASGRLFYVGDMNLSIYKKLTPGMAPNGFTGNGAYAGISDDDGRTWRIRKLTGGNVLDKDGNPVKVQTVSYVTACQSPDGMIHVVTSHNHPDLHFEFNEAWVLDRSAEPQSTISEFGVRITADTVKEYSEQYSNGKTKVRWSAGVGADGHHLLHGKETWYYEDGSRQWQATYNAGRKVSTETYWTRQGKRQWQKDHADDGTYIWTIYSKDERIKAESKWSGKKLLSHKILNR